MRRDDAAVQGGVLGADRVQRSRIGTKLCSGADGRLGDAVAGIDHRERPVRVLHDRRIVRAPGVVSTDAERRVDAPGQRFVLFGGRGERVVGAQHHLWHTPVHPVGGAGVEDLVERVAVAVGRPGAREEHAVAAVRVGDDRAARADIAQLDRVRAARCEAAGATGRRALGLAGVGDVVVGAFVVACPGGGAADRPEIGEVHAVGRVGGAQDRQVLVVAEQLLRTLAFAVRALADLAERRVGGDRGVWPSDPVAFRYRPGSAAAFGEDCGARVGAAGGGVSLQRVPGPAAYAVDAR